MIRFLQPVWLLAVAAGAAARRRVRVAHAAPARVRGAVHQRRPAARPIAPKGIGWRRHLAAAAFLLTLLMLATAMARPSVDTKQPLQRATIMLAIDVSLSMESTDVAPTRIAGRADRREGVRQDAAGRRTTSGWSRSPRPPTCWCRRPRTATRCIQAIDGLQLAEATATGEAVFTCLAAIQSVPADGAAGPPPARIVLLSDGYRTAGRPIEEAAAAAASRRTCRSPRSRSAPTPAPSTSAARLQRVPVDRPSLQAARRDRPAATSTRRRRCPSSSRSTRTWARRSGTRR